MSIGPITREMTMTSRLIVVLVLFVVATGCDPGYQLRPNDWQSVSDHKWKKEFGDFEIETGGIRGLIGESGIDPDLQLHNNTKPIYVESAELRTAKGSFLAEVYDRNAIPPSTTGYHIPVKWEFDRKQPAPTVLGDRCEIVLNLNVGGQPRQIKIEYER